MEITVVTPHIRVRRHLLRDCITSLGKQTLPAKEHIVIEDRKHEGSAHTRHRGLMQVTTPWVTFLDDDDMAMPQHLQRMAECAEETGADYVYPWYEVLGGTDPFPQFFGVPWDPERPHVTTGVVLVRTELAQEIGFIGPAVTKQALRRPGRSTSGDDRRFMLQVNSRGAKIVHLPERTWIWRHHGFGRRGVPGNTSGLPTRW